MQTSIFSEKELANMIKENEADVMVVDFIQRFTTNSDQETRAAEFSHIANTIKSLAMNNKMLIIAGSQMNRMKDASDLDAIKESGGISEAADMVILIERQVAETPSTGDVILHLRKNRNGFTGKVDCKFMKVNSDFIENV
jgi:replicative DNA helicase